MTSPARIGRPARFGGDEVDEALAEERLGEQPGAHVARDLGRERGVEREVEGRARVVRLDRADLADDEAADLDVGARLELAADPVGPQRDGDDVDEDLLEGRDGQPDETDDHDDEAESEGALACIRHDDQPAIRTVVVAPQTARLKKKSTMLTATIEVRTAVPTATPTPAGPPLAV